MAAGRRRTPPRNRVTLARALSKLGVLSRTQAAAAIRAGRVAVDGGVATDPGRWVDPERGITLDGRPARKQAATCFLFHKPAGVVTTRADEHGRRTVYDLLPPGLPWLFPVGRLDQDSSGLLLLTNDTQLGDAIAGADAEVDKVYDVTFDAPLAAADLERFRAGMTLDDGTVLQPVAARLRSAADRTRAILRLREGRNRQIRRMAAAVGRAVVRLHRTAVGPVHLAGLAEGALRPLTPAERDALHRLVVGRRTARGRHGPPLPRDEAT
jgi:23S rRNA pseudouridine2605 synthase